MKALGLAISLRAFLFVRHVTLHSESTLSGKELNTDKKLKKEKQNVKKYFYW